MKRGVAARRDAVHVRHKMPDDSPPIQPTPRRRRWKRWTLLGLLVGGAVLLDGPGWRWIADRAAMHFLPKFGLTGGAKFSGRLSSGDIQIDGLELKGEGAIQSVDLGHLRIHYQPSRVVKGEVESITVTGLHAKLDLDRPWPEGGSKPKASSPPKPLAEILRTLREKLLPIGTDISDLQVTITKSGTPFFTLSSLDLQHPGGGEDFRLKLGEMTFPNAQKLPAQETSLKWGANDLSLEKLALAPGLSVAGVKAELLKGDDVSYAAKLNVNAAKFEVTGTMDTAQARLVEGSLVASETAAMFGQKIPAEAVLETLELKATDLKGGANTLNATVTAGLRGITYEDWTVDALKLTAELKGEAAKLDVDAMALGSPMKLSSRTSLSRSKNFEPQQTDATFSIPKAAEVITALRSRIKELKEPKDVPDSSFNLKATVAFDKGKPARVSSEIQLLPDRPAQVSPIDLTAVWTPDGKVEAGFAVDGARIDAKAEIGEVKHYSGRASFTAFTPDRLSGWLEAFAVSLPREMTLDGTWQGEGGFGPKDHSGKLALTKFDWKQARGGPAQVSGAIDYAWPKKVAIDGITATQGTQKIACDALLENQLLVLKNLRWNDGNDVLLEGTASVPVTEQLGDVKALLKQTRPLAIDIESRELALSRLHPFLAETVRFPDQARGKLALHISGTPAAPQIMGELSGRDLGVQSQKDLPKADLDLKFRTENEQFFLEGALITPGYPAANLAAKLPFKPGVWAEHPELLTDEKLEASVRVPNLELARFASLAPTLKTLAGSLKAGVTVGGTIGKPEPLGVIELKNGAVTLNSDSIPPIEKISLKASASEKAVELQSLALTMSSGTLDGRGKLTLTADHKPGDLDFTLSGRALPLKRDDSMIVRSNLDLTLRGPWTTATLGGKIGIVDSLFYRDIELLPIGVPFNQPSAPQLPSVDVAKTDSAASALPEPFQNWVLAVKVKTDNPFLIRGNLATGVVLLDVDLGGTFGKPAPRGKAILHDVSAKLPFSTLEIADGEVVFRPEAPFDPALNIRGRSVVRPYEVNLFIYGSVSDPKVLTTSNPPLPETEIMTLIATGTTTKGIEDPQAALSRAAQLLVEELRRGRVRYGKRLQPVLKLLDKVDFQIGQENPYSGQKMNAANINLDDNWLLSAGMGEAGNSRAMLMYLIRFR